MNEIEILKLKSQGYCCSQIMIKLMLDLMDKDNRDLVHFAKGLCMGSGMADGPCGIYTAGMGLMTMAARDKPEKLPLMQEEFLDFFLSQGAVSCRGINPDNFPEPDPVVCGSLLDQAFSFLMGQLTQNGCDPQDDPNR